MPRAAAQGQARAEGVTRSRGARRRTRTSATKRTARACVRAGAYKETMLASLLDLQKPLHLTIEGLLSPQECEGLIARIEEARPALAPITTARGPIVNTETRNNSRVMFDDPALATMLYERALPHVPQEVMGMRACGANERLRCYKYEPGQWFKPHYDGAFFRSNEERSLYTFMVYLNEGFTGGQTSFLDLRVDVAPRAGLALLFQHHLLHEGSEVTSGVKYVVRSDIMYRKHA